MFYRLSLAEMFVPYGDPRAPYPRKAAFDLGNDGAGINANNLQLGCDCLGEYQSTCPDALVFENMLTRVLFQEPLNTSTPTTTLLLESL